MDRDEDLVKIKELLRHTGEFIAYFELAETKMIEWRENIEQQAKHHQHKVDEQLKTLQNELDSLQEILTQAGLARFRLSAEKILEQGEKHLESLNKSGQQLINEMNVKHNSFNKFIEKKISLLEEQSQKIVEKINEELGTYDVQHFRRIANESCEHVERTANDAIAKSESFLRIFQWRSISIGLISTIITALAIGLYISNELPWEIHKHAMHERQAGKVLMKAWPSLSEEEKNKILNGLEERG